MTIVNTTTRYETFLFGVLGESYASVLFVFSPPCPRLCATCCIIEHTQQFANDARDEYNKQMIEYRATGSFTPNAEFVKLSNANVWVRKETNRNDLEKEICSYETVVFPKRPPSMDEAYALREQRGIFRRKLRLKGLENSDGTLKNGLDFEVLFKEYQEKGTTLKEQDERTSGDSSHIDEGDDDSEDMEEATGVDV